MGSDIFSILLTQSSIKSMENNSAELPYHHSWMVSLKKKTAIKIILRMITHKKKNGNKRSESAGIVGGPKFRSAVCSCLGGNHSRRLWCWGKKEGNFSFSRCWLYCSRYYRLTLEVYNPAPGRPPVHTWRLLSADKRGHCRVRLLTRHS